MQYETNNNKTCDLGAKAAVEKLPKYVFVTKPKKRNSKTD